MEEVTPVALYETTDETALLTEGADETALLTEVDEAIGEVEAKPKTEEEQAEEAVEAALTAQDVPAIEL